MATQSSYAKLEKEFIHELRENLNCAENITDVMNCFSHVAGSFLRKVFNEKIDIFDEDILFMPGHNKKFQYSKKITKIKEITREASHSDIERIITRFAEAAEHRYMHLNKHAEKSKLKIRGQKNR